MKKMKPYLLRMLIALLTFAAGVMAAGIWFTLRAPSIPKSEVTTSSQINNSNQTLPIISCPGRVPINSYRTYPKIAATLREFVEREGNLKKNTLYISPVEQEDDRTVSYVYWKEDESILLLGLYGENAECHWLSPNKNRPGSWVVIDSAKLDGIIADCILNGKKLTIYRTKR